MVMKKRVKKSRNEGGGRIFEIVLMYVGFLWMGSSKELNLHKGFYIKK